MIRFTTLRADSRRSLQTALACLTLLAATLLAGCGGGSSSSPSPARFAGTYSGSFISNSTPLNIGAITMTVTSSGSLTGNAANEAGHGTATLTGSVNGAGKATINVVNSDSTHDTATGAVTFNSAGDLVGAFTNVAGNTITITVASSAKPLLYAGSYTGTFTRSDGSGSGTVSVTITTAGVLTGSAVNGASTTSLTGTVSNVGIASVTGTNSSGTATDSGATGFDSTGKLILQFIDSSGVITTLTLTPSIT